MIQIKIFAGYRFQMIEDEFNEWADSCDPFIIKTIIDTAPVPRNEQGFSLYFTIAVFYKLEHDEPPEVLNRRAK